MLGETDKIISSLNGRQMCSLRILFSHWNAQLKTQTKERCQIKLHLASSPQVLQWKDMELMVGYGSSAFIRFQKTAWKYSSSGRAPALQMQSPEFKPHSHKQQQNPYNAMYKSL
jgi:hypothetical protein